MNTTTEAEAQRWRAKKLSEKSDYHYVHPINSSLFTMMIEFAESEYSRKCEEVGNKTESQLKDVADSIALLEIASARRDAILDTFQMYSGLLASKQSELAAKDREIGELKIQVREWGVEHTMTVTQYKLLVEVLQSQLQEAKVEVEKLKIIPEECLCKCSDKQLLRTVYPLPDICEYCCKAVPKSRISTKDNSKDGRE